MRKLIIPIICITLFLASLRHVSGAQGQSIPVTPVSFPTLADMRAQASSSNTLVQLTGLVTPNDGNGGPYMWNATSTATDDGFLVVQVTGVATGRYLRQPNPNTIKGIITLSGQALTTAYTISYPLTLPQIPAMVIIQAYSANAAVPSWVSNVTTTGFTANFSSVPVLGTNNITITYLIIKQ